jgi:hypothetical protein
MSSNSDLTTMFVNMCRKDMADSFDDTESLDQVSNLARGAFEKFLALHQSDLKGQGTGIKAKKPRMKGAVSADTETETETTSKPRGKGRAKVSDVATTSSQKSDTSSKKVKKQKDPSAPRKLSGYNVFVNHTMKNHPDFLLPAKPVNEGDAAGVPCKDRMKLCGSMWKGLSDADRTSWNEKALAKNVESGATSLTPASVDAVASSASAEVPSA